MKRIVFGVIYCCLAAAAMAQDVAKQLANPVSSLVSVPFQFNYDDNAGAGERGSVGRLNVQPVVPFSLNEDWNLIARTILPVLTQEDLPRRGDSESGLGDTLQSVFFSPKKPTDDGWIWGVGPALLLPTATDDTLGGERWGAGPTAVALKQRGQWTYGALANHIESFAGSGKRADVSATFLQPFLTFVTPQATTFALNTESTYDWEARQWSVPVNFSVSQLVSIGPQMMQVGGGVRYWLEGPETGPEGWGLRLSLVLVFPR